MLLIEFFDRYYRPLRLRGRSPQTSRLYGCTIRAFARHLGHEPTLDDLADEMSLARFLDERTGTRSPYSAEKERSQLMAMARLANERRMIPALPTCQPVLLPDRVPCAWSAEELRRLFAAAGKAQGFVGVVPAGEWLVALLLAAYETSERIGALLEVAAANYRRPHLHVPGEIRKGGKRSRVYELSPALCDRLDRLAGDGRLFSWPHHPTYLWDRLRRIRIRAGLAGKRLAFQQLRRSSISHVAASGADPVAYAGHAQGATTRRWYVDPRLVPQGPRPADMLPAVVEPPPVERGPSPS